MAVAAEGEKRGATEEVENGEERSTASEKEKEEAAASEKGKGVAEAKEEVAGGKRIFVRSTPEEKLYEVSEAEARLSVFLEGLLEIDDNGKDIHTGIHSSARTLDTVFEYCAKHAEADGATKSRSDPVAAAATKSTSNPSAEAGSSVGGVNTAAPENLEDWDRKLVDSLSMDDLLLLLNAAEFLSIDGLTDLIYQKVADTIKGKTTEEIRATFNIANDFTPEEEADCRRQYASAFDACDDDE